MWALRRWSAGLAGRTGEARVTQLSGEMERAGRGVGVRVLLGRAGKGAGLGRAGWAECWGGLGWVWVELVGSLGVGLGVWAPFLISFLFYFFSFLNLILIQLKTNEFKFKFEFTQALNK